MEDHSGSVAVARSSCPPQLPQAVAREGRTFRLPTSLGRSEQNRIALGRTAGERQQLAIGRIVAGKERTGSKVGQLLLHTAAENRKRPEIRRSGAPVGEGQGAIVRHPACSRVDDIRRDWDVTLEFEVAGLRRDRHGVDGSILADAREDHMLAVQGNTWRANGYSVGEPRGGSPGKRQLKHVRRSTRRLSPIEHPTAGRVTGGVSLALTIREFHRGAAAHVKPPQMVGAIDAGAVHHTLATLADGGGRVVPAKRKLPHVATIRIRQEKVPVFRVVACVHQLAVGRKREAT